MTKVELEGPSMLLVTGDTSQFQEVKQHDQNELFKTLGIHSIIPGDLKAQISDMKKRRDEYAQGILSISVTHSKA